MLRVGVMLAAEPLRLATGEPEAPESLVWLWFLGGGVLLALIIAVLIARYIMMSAEERAFHEIAAGLNLRSRHRRRLRGLARTVGAAPVALLLCEGAFHKALRVCAQDAQKPRERAALTDLQNQVFGISSNSWQRPSAT
ncbi:MAG: hypothetical protein AAFX05_12790 [Planctomycetota bacterium]